LNAKKVLALLSSLLGNYSYFYSEFIEVQAAISGVVKKGQQLLYGVFNF
jgi:hypothetical protein